MRDYTLLECPECNILGTIEDGYYSCGHPATDAAVLAPLPETSRDSAADTRISGDFAEGRIISYDTRRRVIDLGLGQAFANGMIKLTLLLLLLVFLPSFLPLLILIVAGFLLLSFLRIPLGGLFAIAMGMGIGGKPPGYDPRADVEVPVTTFLLEVRPDRLLEVNMEGELSGASLHLGHHVAVTGTMNRQGTLNAREVRNTFTNARTTVRKHPAVVRSQRATIRGILLLVVDIVLVYSLYQLYLT